MRLAARVIRLERSAAARGLALARYIVVRADHGPPTTSSTPAGLCLTVPWSYHDSPLRGLSDAQRAQVGLADRIIALAYVRDWRPGTL